MKLTNLANLPKVIERAVTNDPYDSDGSDISATRLVAPPRIVALQKKHAHEIEEDVSDRIWSLLGQSVHHVIERSVRSEDISELRLFYKDKQVTNDWTISGTFDYLQSDGNLVDFKVTSAWSVLEATTKGKPEWEQQLNILDYLCSKNSDKLKNIQVKKLYIMAILRDWSKNKAQETNSDYPKKQVVIIPIKRWNKSQQEEFIKQRVLAHQKAQTATTAPVCSSLERWSKPDQFAVMKNGRKTALRLLSTMQDAKKYIKDKNMTEGKGCSIVHRVGSDVRCEQYCNVNKFCDYYNKELAF